MKENIMLIYPGIMLFVLFFGAKIKKHGFNEEAWSLSQAKCLQAFAAIMIILHHCVQTITEYGRVYKGLITEWNSFGILFTSIFFFFSGYGLYAGYKNKEGYMDGFLGKHLPKLLIPFFITNIIYLIVLPFGRISTITDVFTSIFGFTLINTNAWFLVELVILYISFYFCFSKAKTENKALMYQMLVITAIVLFSLLLGHDNSQINGHWFMGEWWYNTTYIFAMGIFVSKYEKKIKAFAKEKYMLLLPIVIVLFFACFILEVYVINHAGYYQEWRWHPGYPEKLLSLIVQIVLCMLFMCAVLLINLKVRFSNRALSFLGKISFEIYLIHDIFRQSLYNEDVMPDVVYIGLVIIFSIAAAWGLSLIDKVLLEFYFENSNYFWTFKKQEENPDATYEYMQKQKKKRSIINKIKAFYLVAFVGLIVSVVINVFQLTVGANMEYESELSALKKAEVGDVVYFGKWDLDYSDGGVEQIPWVVYDIKDNHMFLISEYVLEDMYYHDHYQKTTWKESKLCRLLNHDFYQDAFNKKERQHLCGRYDVSTGSRCNSEREAYDYFINREGKYDFEDVVVKKDLVFIPSVEDLKKYMPTDADRKATFGTADQGRGLKNDEYVAWWLTDMGTGKLTAMFVNEDGQIDEIGKTISNTGMGVRPAIWIDLK